MLLCVVVTPDDQLKIPVSSSSSDRRGSLANNLYTRYLAPSVSFKDRLVEAYRPKFCPPRMQIAVSTRVSQVWYSSDRKEQLNGVTKVGFFVKGLELVALGAKSLTTTGLRKGQN